jgi:hypothetical protein
LNIYNPGKLSVVSFQLPVSHFVYFLLATGY